MYKNVSIKLTNFRQNLSQTAGVVITDLMPWKTKEMHTENSSMHLFLS